MWYTDYEHSPYETFYSESTTRNSWSRFCRRFRVFFRSGGALLAENLLPMKKTIAALAASLFILVPSVSMAAGINYQQASAIIVLLEAFGVNSSTIATVWTIIQPGDTPLTPPTIATTQNASPNFGGTTVVNPQLEPLAPQAPMPSPQPINQNPEPLAPQNDQDQVAIWDGQINQLEQQAETCFASLPPPIDDQLGRVAMDSKSKIMVCESYEQEITNIQNQIKLLGEQTVVENQTNIATIAPMNNLTLTAAFEAGSDVRAHSLPNKSQAVSGSPYPDIIQFYVALSDETVPLDQVTFSVIYPENSLIGNLTYWPTGGKGNDGPPYSDKIDFSAGFSQPGTYPIVITATDPNGNTVTQTLTVIAH